ncbi:hypothetical protein ACFLUD_03265 [Chloroflexota bacterium]
MGNDIIEIPVIRITQQGKKYTEEHIFHREKMMQFYPRGYIMV